MQSYDVVALFSGGLDSILAARLIQAQNLRVLGLHAYSPFFGSPGEMRSWERLYGIPLTGVDVGEQFLEILKAPPHGFGKALNPCIDCKILILKEARRLMEACGAFCIISGEVLGQRPMSQRRDTLHVIAREAGVKDLLLRPLSALHLEPSPAERDGRIDRSRLLGISGRGRTDQLRLAGEYSLKRIPSPAGGCRLTERENTRRYWMILRTLTDPTVHDFTLANTGRQLWSDEGHWFIIGRNRADNQRIRDLVRDEDCLISFPDIPGPLALARFGTTWPRERLIAAGEVAFSYATKALLRTAETKMYARMPSQSFEAEITPRRTSSWTVPDWETVHQDLTARHRAQAEADIARKAQRRLRKDVPSDSPDRDASASSGPSEHSGCSESSDASGAS